MTTVSRPPEAPRRRVLGSTNDLGNKKSSSPVLPSSRPIRAKVDLGASSSSSNASSWTPTQPVRARVAMSGGVSSRSGFSSAPATPNASSAVFARAGGSQIGGASGSVRATLSPQTPTARAPSPSRARSPDVNNARPVSTRAQSGNARTTTTPNMTPRADSGFGAAHLRGQQGPFPTPVAPVAMASTSTTTAASPINYLPTSVSTRRLHSPTVRSPKALSKSTASSTTSTASLPALSTSPGSSVSSPLLSPDLRGYEVRTSTEDSTEKLPRRLDASNTGRSSGASSVSSSSEARLLPPLHVAGDDARPIFARSTSVLSSHSAAPPKSPSLQAFPSAQSRSQNPLRSPTLSTFPAPSRALDRAPTTTSSPFPSRPPLTQQNPSQQQRRSHTRSLSTASVSSLSSVLSASDGRLSPRQAGPSPLPSTWGYSASPAVSPQVNSPIASSHARPPLAAVDWLVAAAEEQVLAQTSPRSEGRLSNGSQGQASALSAESGMDDHEKEAKVDRRIADLEIRNASLLTINADLERMKVKHRKEIRELRRKLRESVGGAGLAALRAQMTSLDEGIEDVDEDYVDGSGDEGDPASAAAVMGLPEPTWPEILEEDPAFSAIAATLEGLIGRAKRAIEYEPARNEMAGRVLSAAEVEERFLHTGGGASSVALFDPASTSTSTSNSASDDEGQRSRTITRASSMRGLAINGLGRHSPLRR
ncbi:hypothetical protein JCM10908_005681 [Rhodotorula pacifica]|uniref:uncharacterized protein n=1 Tax=Rhodotorula pacifica TaxID=1495444 RepID=UPI003170E4A9